MRGWNCITSSRERSSKRSLRSRFQDSGASPLGGPATLSAYVFYFYFFSSIFLSCGMNPCFLFQDHISGDRGTAFQSLHDGASSTGLPSRSRIDVLVCCFVFFLG